MDQLIFFLGAKGLFILVLATILIAVVWLARKLIYPQMTTASMDQSFKNGLWTMAIMIIVLAVVGGLVYLVFHSIDFTIIGLIFFGSLIIYFLYASIRGWRERGKLLLVVMPNPAKTVSFFWLFLMGFACLVGTLPFLLPQASLNAASPPDNLSNLKETFKFAAYFVLGLVNLIIGFQNIQLHENGIVVYVDLIKWEKIESWYWMNDDDGKNCTMKLTYTGNTPLFLRSGAMPVPSAKKAAVEEIFSSRIPGKMLHSVQ